ncbi:hypothetical protein K32_23630 [Kaistia sp. 32K]|nr:hypothetical protein K32_23630 [Kaistia sp. 32K]
MSPVIFDRTWPFYVPIPTTILRDRFRELEAQAEALGAAPEHRDLVLNDVWHSCFCFATLEAAQAFAAPNGAEIKDARKRINKGTWQLWEEKGQTK